MKNFAKNLIKNLSFFAAFLVPLEFSQNWHQYKFSSIQKNKVEFNKNLIKILVDSSASPLIYAFKRPRQVTSFEVKAKQSGERPTIPEHKIQGQTGFDDFVLRFGLIIKGDSRLNWAQRLLAPQWLVDMERLLPKTYGIKEVIFYTTCQQKQLLNQRRKHILDSSLKETCILLLKKSGNFIMQKKLDPSINVIGIWLGTDGDQTRLKYQLEVSQIKINYN